MKGLFLICLYYVQHVTSSELDSNLIKPLYNITRRVGEEDIVFRVVNGTPAKLGDVPYQISLKVLISRKPHQTYRSICGGTIIGSRKIVTAAHCLVDDRKRSRCQKGTLTKKQLGIYCVVAGQLNTAAPRPRRESESTGQWRDLSEGRFPPKYKFPNYDIAIIFTVTKFKFNNFVARIAYATVGQDYGSGKNAMDGILSGYGLQEKNAPSLVLRVAQLKILSIKTCSRLHHMKTQHFICTSDEASDSNKGDSGGPLIIQTTKKKKKSKTKKENSTRSNVNDTKPPKISNLLIGVVCGKNLKVKFGGSFFTRVSSYAPFISNSNNTVTPRFVLIISLFIHFNRYLNENV